MYMYLVDNIFETCKIRFLFLLRCLSVLFDEISSINFIGMHHVLAIINFYFLLNTMDKNTYILFHLPRACR